MTVRDEFKMQVPYAEARKYAEYDPICQGWHVTTLDDLWRLYCSSLVQVTFFPKIPDRTFVYFSTPE